MILASSSVAAAKRDSLIAFYGPFASAFLLILVIVVPASEGVPDTQAAIASTVSVPPLAEERVKQTEITALMAKSATIPPLTNAAIAIDTQTVEFALAVTAVSIQSEPIAADNSLAVQEFSVQTAQLLINEVTEDHLQLAFMAPAQETPVFIDSSDTEEITEQSTQPVSWSLIADSLASYSGPQLTLDFDQNLPTSGNDDRFQRPDTLQRPALPPAQLVRPIQRAVLLPPPIRALIP